jgi:uncharacterized protein YpmB
MNKAIEKHVIKITVIAFISFLVTICTFVWQIATAYSKLENHESRITSNEEDLKQVATKEDLDSAVKSLKEYINKH